MVYLSKSTRALPAYRLNATICSSMFLHSCGNLFSKSYRLGYTMPNSSCIWTKKSHVDCVCVGVNKVAIGLECAALPGHAIVSPNRMPDPFFDVFYESCWPILAPFDHSIHASGSISAQLCGQLHVIGPQAIKRLARTHEHANACTKALSPHRARC